MYVGGEIKKKKKKKKKREKERNELPLLTGSSIEPNILNNLFIFASIAISYSNIFVESPSAACKYSASVYKSVINSIKRIF